MTDLVELAYTMLLGWMRALVDWFWSIFSGTGNTGAWSWFLSNWKVWLAILLIGGLVVDWLMWVVRWRPYRLLTSRLHSGKKAGDEASGEAWDSGVGYYATETAADSEPMDWKETTFATLSEIDPNWAGSVRMDADDDDLYEDAYEPAHLYDAYASPDEPAQPESGYWDETPDELDADEAEGEAIEIDGPYKHLYESTARFTPSYGAAYAEAEEIPYDGEEEPYAEEGFYPEEDDGYEDAYEADAAPLPPEGFDPFAPYDAYDPEEVPGEYAQADVPAEAPREDTGPVLYGRPGYWPGVQYPTPRAAPEMDPEVQPEAEAQPEEESYTPAPPPEAYDPLFNPDAPPETAPRRRRRRLREQTLDDIPRVSVPDPDPEPEDAAPIPDWLQTPQSTAPAYQEPLPPKKKRRTIPGYVNQQDAFADTRPSRIVQPPEPPPMPPEPRKVSRGEKIMRRMRGDNVKTVTGKPAKPRGLRRFTSLQDDPISGLPPLDLTNPFMPVVHPDDIDFEPDDGQEYDE